MKSVVAPGDLNARMKAPHVVELAISTDRLGKRPGNRPWVMKVRHGWKLIAGRDRFAAHSINGEKQLPVEVVLEATPEELATLERHENLHRRQDNRAAMIREEVEAEALRIAALRTSDTSVSKVGRPKSPEAEAREHVAARLGTTPGAVKEAVRREKVREGAAEGAAKQKETGTSSASASSPSPIETFGNALPGRVRDEVVPVLTALKDVLLHVGRAKTAAQALMLVSFDTAAHGRIEDAIAELQGMVRGLTPSHACPYCIKKGVDKRCAACGGNGYVTKAVFASAPAELRGGWTDEERAAGLGAEPQLGAPFPLVPALPRAKPKSRCKVVIVDEQGVEHEVTE